MIDAFLFIITCVTFSTFLAPRLFRWCDSRRARTRIHIGSHPHAQRVKVERQHSAPIDQFFDALARLIRSHQPARDALLHLAHLLPNTPEWNSCVLLLQKDVHLAEIISSLHAWGDEYAHLLATAFTTSNFSPEALEHAAHIVRERRHIEQSLMVATAQARLTIRLLTVLPLAVFIIGVLASSAMRSVLLSRAVIAVLTTGIVLNRMGAWWAARSIYRSIHQRRLPQSVALIESLCVSLRAGHSPTHACLSWHSINSLGQNVAQLLRDGAPLPEALQPLVATNHQFDAFVAHTLTNAHTDGLPIHSAASLLANEARNAQRADVESRIRQLPTRLSLPLVFCVLPSFVFLTLAPLLLAHLSRFGSSLPSPIS